jgi:hypothetical protein
MCRKAERLAQRLGVRLGHASITTVSRIAGLGCRSTILYEKLAVQPYL